MSYLLDTNVLIEWFHDGPAQDEIEELLRGSDAALHVSWIAVSEYLVKARSYEKEALFRTIESGDLILLNLSALDLAEVTAEVRRETGLPLPDSIILATAKSNSLTLLTRDRDLVKRGKGFYSRVKQVG